MTYKLINTISNTCVNAIEWNGVVFDPETGLGWTPPADHVAIQSDIIQIGDEVELVGEVWQKK